MSILGFGEIVWDDIVDQSGSGRPENIGGAPFNVIAHCKRLGMRSGIVSALGTDPLGNKTLDVVNNMGVNTELVSRTEKSTCIICVTFEPNGEPRYHIGSDVSWDHITISDEDINTLRSQKYHYFYYGTLHQRSRTSQEALKKILINCSFPQVYCDVNLREPFYSKELLEFCLTHCDIAKMNIEEAGLIGDMFHINISDTSGLIYALKKMFGMEKLIITQGADGANYLSSDEYGFADGYRIKVADTVGAGDAFSAGLLYMLRQNRPLSEACAFANRMGAFVASHKSSIPDYTYEELLNWREGNV